MVYAIEFHRVLSLIGCFLVNQELCSRTHCVGNDPRVIPFCLRPVSLYSPKRAPKHRRPLPRLPPASAARWGVTHPALTQAEAVSPRVIAGAMATWPLRGRRVQVGSSGTPALGMMTRTARGVFRRRRRRRLCGRVTRARSLGSVRAANLHVFSLSERYLEMPRG